MNEIKCVIVELEPYKTGDVLKRHNRTIRVCEIEDTICIYDDMACVLNSDYSFLQNG